MRQFHTKIKHKQLILKSITLKASSAHADMYEGEQETNNTWFPFSWIKGTEEATNIAVKNFRVQYRYRGEYMRVLYDHLANSDVIAESANI